MLVEVGGYSYAIEVYAHKIYFNRLLFCNCSDIVKS